MAAQLRIILLVLGVALIVSLWIWERRRSGLPRADAVLRSTDRFEPRLDVDGHGATSAPEPKSTGQDLDDSRELPAMRASVTERPVPHGDPPLMTIEDLPEDPSEVVFATPAAPVPAEQPAGRRAPRAGSARAERRRPVPDPPPEPPPLAPVAAPEPEELPAPKEPLAETPARHQRIIAIRLLARDRQRIEGRDLKAALAGEGLEFGRYAIYHRRVDGARPLFSVASLLEPGTFDPETMDSARFPGVSLFAVFPGPLPAPQCFDDLLSTARRLADRLAGTLHDDSGSSLTGQRVLAIREDLVHFEHLVALSRSRPLG